MPLSQNDVTKQTLDQNIGGPDPEDGVFGVSILRSIKADATEYKNIKRDRAEAIKRKAWGLWTAQYTPEVIETETENIIIEWEDGDIDSVKSTVEDLGPGEMVHSDAAIQLKRHDAEVPELGDTLQHYVADILAPLPAPKFVTGHEDDINRDVTSEQDPRYQQLVEEERDVQEASWTAAFRRVAERHEDLDPAGLQLKIEPEPEESPIMSLDNDAIERISTFAGAIADLYGPGGAPAFIQEQVLNELILHLPEDASIGDANMDEALDEADPEVREQFRRLQNEA